MPDPYNRSQKHRDANKRYRERRIAMGMPSNHLNTKCPLCGNPKDDRAKICQSCHNKSGDARRGTGNGYFYSKGYKYVLAPNHPQSSEQGYIEEHRLVMEQHIGRYLLPNEQIHHINETRSDNRIENLLIVSAHTHRDYHLSQLKGTTWKIIDGRRIWLCPL